MRKEEELDEILLEHTVSSTSVEEAQKKARKISLPFAVQLFLIVSLIVIVVSISLLFRFFAVVAVDKIGSIYMSTAVAQVERTIAFSLNDTIQSLDFVTIPSRCRGEQQLSLSQLFASRCKSSFSVFNCDALYVAWSLNESVGCTAKEGCWDSIGEVCNGTLGCPALDIAIDAGQNETWSMTVWPNKTLRILQIAREFYFEEHWVLAAVNISGNLFREALRSIGGDGGLAASIRDARTGRVLVTTSTESMSADPEHFTQGFHQEVSLGGFVAYVEAGQSIVRQLQKGTFVIVAISVTIALAVCIVGVLLLRIILAPLSKLTQGMEAAVCLRFDHIRVESSMVREINAMAISFCRMVSRLRGYKGFLQQLLEDRKQFHLDDNVPGGLGENETENAKHLIRVQLVYVSRKSNYVKQSAAFEHTYADGDEELFEKFLADCIENVHAHRYDHMAVLIQSRGTVVQVNTNRQLEEAISTSPGVLEVMMKKDGVKTLLSPFSLFVDFTNLVLNSILIVMIFFDSTAVKSERLAITLFTSLYSFTIAVNICISLWLLNWGAQQNSKFKDWLAQAGFEVSILLLLCSLNTQHIHFLWSHWTILGLKFNAPRDIELWKRCVLWSIFGFFFADIFQLMFKAYYLLTYEKLVVPLAVALATSVTSIAMGLPKKVSYFAMISRKVTDVEEEELGAVRTRSGNQFQSLFSQDVTLVLFYLPDVESKTLGRVSSDCSAFYSTVVTQVKSNDGTILYFQGSDVVALFNAPKPVDNHCAKAVDCSFSIMDALRTHRVHIVAAIDTGDMLVGNLGCQTRKSFQCFGPLRKLRRMADLARFTQTTTIGTSAVASHLDNRTYKMQRVKMMTADEAAVIITKSFFLAPSENVPVPPSAHILSPFSIVNDDADTVDVIGSYVSQWVEKKKDIPFEKEIEDEEIVLDENTLRQQKQAAKTRTAAFVLRGVFARPKKTFEDFLDL